MEKSFLGWLITIFATVMKAVAPTLCVKYFTKRQKSNKWGSYSNQYAYLFLPRSEKQLKAIEKLKLTKDQLQERVWSKETMASLFKANNFALVDHIRHDEKDFLCDEVVATDDDTLIACFFKKVTPSADYLRRFVSKSPKAGCVAILAPSIFNDLTYEDLPEDKEVALSMLGTFLTLDLAEKRNKVTAEHWAKEVIKLESFYAQELKDSEAFVFDAALSVLIDVDYNFAPVLKALQQYHPMWYAEIRDRSGEKDPNLAKYLAVMLPDIAERLGALANGKLGYFTGSNLKSDEDAMAWLYQAVEGADQYEVQLELLKIKEIGTTSGVWMDIQATLMKKVSIFGSVKMAYLYMPKSYTPRLERRLVNSIDDPYAADVALTLLGKAYQDDIVEIMVEKTDSFNVSVLEKYFPFTDWKEKTALKAIEKLVAFNAFQTTRMEELREELRPYAKERLEVHSEIVHLSKKDVDEEVLKHKLYPESEVYLFTNRGDWDKHSVYVYVENNELSDKGFVALVSTEIVHGNSVVGLYNRIIEIYAKNHGLSEKKYITLMGSPYANLGPQLRQYLKVTDSDEAKEAVYAYLMKRGLIADDAENGSRTLDEEEQCELVDLLCPYFVSAEEILHNYLKAHGLLDDADVEDVAGAKNEA